MAASSLCVTRPLLGDTMATPRGGCSAAVADRHRTPQTPRSAAARRLHVSASSSRDIVAASAAVSTSARDEAVAVMKKAAKDKSVGSRELALALVTLEKSKGELPDDVAFLKGLGGTQSPGITWQLVFTTNGKLKESEANGSYFPITAIQRFDAAALEIENGVFLKPVGYLTFKGPFSFANKKLAFLFDVLSIKLGPLPLFKFNIGKKEDEGRKPGIGKEGKGDPFFVWFYVDEDIIAARGRGGGAAFWRKYDGDYKG